MAVELFTAAPFTFTVPVECNTAEAAAGAAKAGKQLVAKKAEATATMEKDRKDFIDFRLLWSGLYVTSATLEVNQF